MAVARGVQGVTLAPPSATWSLKKIDIDYSKWMIIKKNVKQFVIEILTCHSMFFLSLHLKIFV